MKRNSKKLLALILAIATLAAVFASCGNDPGNPAGNGAVIDNESTRLVLSTSELDGVFNPFYSSSGPDGTIVGMTQISMLSSDKEGKVAYGQDEACVVLDYEAIPQKDKDGNTTSTIYRFVLKNNLKFSNGSALTMKDVLFNLYVYLDPAYYGSATIYSTEILGLQEYRTQSKNESEQDNFDAQFVALASDRVQRLRDCLEIVYENNKGKSLDDAKMISELTAVMNEFKTEMPEYGTIVND